jgi:tetratricopeptide (TPR) repeat protein
MHKALWIGLLLVAALARGADFEAARRDASAGDIAYEAGDYALAMQHYEAALAAGLDHADVHFNLGNAHYKQGELGLAIAAYERALLRSPRHGAARANLERAKQQTRDEAFAPLALPRFLQPLRWIYARLSLNEWASLAWLGLCVAALAGIAGHWRPRWRRRLRPYALGALVLCASALAIAGLHSRRDFGRERGVVRVEEAEVRSGPGDGYNLSFKVHEGLTVFVSERRGEWLQIHLGGELVGWLPAAQVEII